MRPSVYLVAIGGPSLLGKTSITQSLRSVLPAATIVHQDDFYFPTPQLPIDKETGYQNWDCSDAIDFDRLLLYLKLLKENGLADASIPSREPPLLLALGKHQIAEFRDILHRLKIGRDVCDCNVTIVLVDGFMLLNEPRIRNLFDVRLFVYASRRTLYKRRTERGTYITDVGDWEDPPDYFDKIVWPSYESSHGFLFDSRDPDKTINSAVTENLRIVPLSSESTSIQKLVSQALDVIIKSY